MNELDRKLARIAEALSGEGIVFRQNEPLARYTTMGLGGPVDLLVQPASAAQVETALALVREHHVPLRVLGAGSNLLVSDAGVRGVILHTASLNQVELLQPGTLIAGAGVHFPALVRRAAQQGLRGLEPGVGIPGSLGGVLTMNAGAYQFAIGPLVEEVEVVSPDRGHMVLRRGEFDFRYRASSFGADLIVAGATLSLQRDEPEAIKADMDAHMRFRKETQPVGVKSAGCIFKNPAGESAGRLIDSVGLKGIRVGAARISEVHANFIVHDGTASAADVLGLIATVQEQVFSKTSVQLEREVMTWQ